MRKKVSKKKDLNKIKVAIFDFDETLAIHKDKDYLNHRNESEERLLNYYLKAYLNPKSFYETIEPCVISKQLYTLIRFLKHNNVKMYCISGMNFSFHLKAKEIFIHTHYDNDIEMISTGSQELKIDAVRMIQKINACDLKEILFIDDIKDNIIRFNNIGINALLPEEIK